MNNKTKTHAVIMAYGLTVGKLSTKEIIVSGSETPLSEYFESNGVIELGNFMNQAQSLNVNCTLDDINLECNLFELYVAYTSFADIKQEKEQQV